MTIDYKIAAEKIEDFIREKTKTLNGGVIGLSGGIDSTVIAYLAERAIGKDKVFGVCLPYKDQDYKEGEFIAKTLGLDYVVKNIAPGVDANIAADPDIYNTNLQKGNLMARERMIALYAIAAKKGMLVLGTTNKTEFELGYFTKHGDGAVDIEPIADLYKTEVWKMAKYLGVPDEYIEKSPTAGLWLGQTDEKELGVDYKTIDRILKGENGIEKNKVERIKQIQKATMHKKTMPASVVLR